METSLQTLSSEAIRIKDSLGRRHISSSLQYGEILKSIYCDVAHNRHIENIIFTINSGFSLLRLLVLVEETEVCKLSE